jgi:hypothetical protein
MQPEPLSLDLNCVIYIGVPWVCIDYSIVILDRMTSAHSITKLNQKDLASVREEAA